MAAPEAFVGGIVLALQCNGAAIATRLCTEHRELLARAHLGTRHTVRPEQARR
jgi:hypothetical protein